MRGLGAAFVVDRDGDIASQVRALRPQGVDAVIHLAGDPASLATVLTPDGRIASLLVMNPEQLGVDASRARPVVARPDPAILDRLGAEVASGRLRVRIDATYPLAEVPAAFRNFAEGKTGKIAVAVE
jgi:NADPH:quinone reductase-like Zn-dependent oxidoreductase